MLEKNNQQFALINNSQFAEMIFIGVRRVESFSTIKEDSVDSYDGVLEAIESKQHSGKLMLGFFSIPGVSGESMDKVDSIVNFNPEVNEVALRQILKKIALIDFAEAREENAGKINVLITSDAIIHWDLNGSYIQPTDDHSYLFDLEEIVKQYPSSYEILVYTEKDLSAFKFREVSKLKISEVPITQRMWYNQPSFQQVYGNIVLVGGIVTLAMVYGIINWQKGSITEINSKISNLQSVTVDESFYSKSNEILLNFGSKQGYKEIYSLVLKDITASLSKSGFELDVLSVNSKKDNFLVVTISSKLYEHTQFSVQEPLAKSIINNSNFIKAIRKKTSIENRLELEAVVDLEEVKSDIIEFGKGKAS